MRGIRKDRIPPTASDIVSNAAAIRKEIPSLKVRYETDPVRQAIAESWPNRMDDSCAREEWGWAPRYDLSTMTSDMILHLKEKLLK